MTKTDAEIPIGFKCPNKVSGYRCNSYLKKKQLDL